MYEMLGVLAIDGFRLAMLNPAHRTRRPAVQLAPGIIGGLRDAVIGRAAPVAFARGWWRNQAERYGETGRRKIAKRRGFAELCGIGRNERWCPREELNLQPFP